MLEKKVLATVLSSNKPQQTIHLSDLINKFKNAAKSAKISNKFNDNDAILVGTNLTKYITEYLKHTNVLLQESGTGFVTQFELCRAPQRLAALLLEKELGAHEWHFADAMQLICDLIEKKYFDKRDSIVDVCLKERFDSLNSDTIRFKLHVERNLHGNLSIDIDMHVVSLYNLNGDFREDICDDGKYCVYILKS